MKLRASPFLASLDPKDRRMILIAFGLIIALLVALAVFTPGEDPSKNTVPGTYFPGQHGAKAAFTLLEQSGYTVERWQQPLSELAAQSNPQTVLILAEPFIARSQDRRAVATILKHGGRVLATGLQGGQLLPNSRVTQAKGVEFAACEAQPEGLSPLAAPGPIWIVPRFTWKDTDPAARAAYSCAGQPVVVQYPVGNGQAIWWASSTPLENGSILRGRNLELLLNSIGPAQYAHIYWDESLHGRSQLPSPWDYVKGPVWPLLSFGSVALVLLLVLSYSRRSGPIRALPQPPRTTPIEFLDALGALYRATGAANTALQIAWERFRQQAAALTGLSLKTITGLNAHQIAQALERRFGPAAAQMEPDLQAAEEACANDTLKARQALHLVRLLRQHERTLRQTSSVTRVRI